MHVSSSTSAQGLQCMAQCDGAVHVGTGSLFLNRWLCPCGVGEQLLGSSWLFR